MAINSRDKVKKGNQKAIQQDPVTKNLVTQPVNPVGPSAQYNRLNHLVNAEPTCRSEASFMLMFPQLSNLPTLARSFSFARIIREQLAVDGQKEGLEEKAAKTAKENLLGKKDAQVEAEKIAGGEASTGTKTSISKEHRAIMDAFNVDLSFEDNSVDPGDSLSLIFSMDDLSQACPTGTGKGNALYLGRLSKPFILPVAYNASLHQQDLFGILAPNLNPSATGPKDVKEALSAIATWKAFSFHNQFRRTEGGLNRLYALIGSRYITDWAAAFSPALLSKSSNILEANHGRINFTSGNYGKVLQARGLFTLSTYNPAQLGTLKTGLHYKPGIWGANLNTQTTVSTLDKASIKTREYMNLRLKTEKAKKEMQLVPAPSTSSNQTPKTNADILRLGFEWKDYVESLIQTSKGKSSSGVSFDMLRSKYLPMIVKVVKDQDGSHVVSTVDETYALEIAKSVKVYGYENPPLYELGMPKPKEMSPEKYEEFMRGLGVSYKLDKNYTFIGTIVTANGAVPFPKTFDKFSFDKIWTNRDPQDKNYFDLLQEDLIVSDLEIYTKAAEKLGQHIRSIGGVEKLRAAAFENTPFLPNGNIKLQEMLKYQRNDAKPPLPTVQPQEVENYTPHAFTSVDGGKMIFGKRLVSNPEGVPLLEDSEIKAHSLLGESGFILDRLPGEVFLTSNPALTAGKPLPMEGELTPEGFVLSNAVYPSYATPEQAAKEAKEAEKIKADRQLIGEIAGFVIGQAPAPMRFDAVANGFDAGTAPESGLEDGVKSNIAIPINVQKNDAVNSILDAVLRIMFNPSALGTNLVAPLISGSLANRTPGSEMFEFYIDGGVGENSIIVAEVGNRISFDFALHTGPLANQYPTDLLQFVRPAEFNTDTGKYNRTFLTFALKGEPPLTNQPSTATYFVPGRKTCYVDMSNLVTSGLIDELFSERLVAIYLKTPADKLAPAGLQAHGHLVENMMAYYFWLSSLFILKSFGAFPPGDLGANVKAKIGEKGYIPLDDFYTLINVTSIRDGEITERPIYPMYLDPMGKVQMSGNQPLPLTKEFVLPENFATQIGMIQSGFMAKAALPSLGYRGVIADIGKVLNLKNAKRLSLGGSFDVEEKGVLGYDGQTNQENPMLGKNSVIGQTEMLRVAEKVESFSDFGSYYTAEPADLASVETSRKIDTSGPAIFDLSIEDVTVRPVVTSTVVIKATGSASVPFAPGNVPQVLRFRPYYPRSFLDLHTITNRGFNNGNNKALIVKKTDPAGAEIDFSAIFLPKVLAGKTFSENGDATTEVHSKSAQESAYDAVRTIIEKSALQILGDPLAEADVQVLKRMAESDLPAVVSLLSSNKLSNVASLMHGPLSFNSRISLHDTAGNPSYPMSTTDIGDEFKNGIAFGFVQQGEANFFPVDFCTSIGMMFSQSGISRAQRKAAMQGVTHIYELMKHGKRIKAYPNAKNPLAGVYAGAISTSKKPTKDGKDTKTNYYVLVIPDVPKAGLPSIDDMKSGIDVGTATWQTNNASLDNIVFKQDPSYGIVAPGNIFGTYNATDEAVLQDHKSPVDDAQGNPNYHYPLLAMDTYGYFKHYKSGSRGPNAAVNSRHDYNKRYCVKNMRLWIALMDSVLADIKNELKKNETDDAKYKAIKFLATNLQFLKQTGEEFLIPQNVSSKYVLRVDRAKLFGAGGPFETFPKTIGNTTQLVDEIMKVLGYSINFPTDFSIYATNNEKQNLTLWIRNAWESSIYVSTNEISFSPTAWYLANVFTQAGEIWRLMQAKTKDKKNPNGLKTETIMAQLRNVLDGDPGVEGGKGASWNTTIELLREVDPLLLNGGLSIRFATDKNRLGGNTSQLLFTSGKLNFEIGLSAFFAPGLKDGGKKNPGIGDFNAQVADDIGNISVSYGTLFPGTNTGVIPVSLFVSEGGEKKKKAKKVLTHTGLIFDDQQDPAMSPFIMTGAVEVKRKTVNGEDAFERKPIQEGRFSLIDAPESNAALAMLGFDAGEACRTYLALRWWMKEGNAPESLQKLMKARSKNLYVMDFKRSAAELALYLTKAELPKKAPIFEILSASYGTDLGAYLRSTGTTFGDSSSGGSNNDPYTLSRIFLKPQGSERRVYMPSFGGIGIPMTTPRIESSAALQTKASSLGVNFERTLPAFRFLSTEVKNPTQEMYRNPKTTELSKFFDTNIVPQREWPKLKYRYQNEITESVDVDMLWIMYSLFSARVFVGTDAIALKTNSVVTVDVIGGAPEVNTNPTLQQLENIADLIQAGERADVADNVVRF